MGLIVDTNIFFSGLIRDSLTRRMLTHLDEELFTIRASNEELSKYKQELLQKGKLNEQALYTLLDKLYERVIIIGDDLIKRKMPEAKRIMDKIDPADTPFIAAALVCTADIWSDDAHFTKQKQIKVWKTIDLFRKQ